MNRQLKIIIKLVLYFSPKCIKERLHNIQEKKEMKEGLERAKRTKVKKEELLSILDNLELNSDVMLHTSIINVGKIEGGAKFIANTIVERVVGSYHTLIVSALPYRGAFKEYLKDKPVFDVRTAPIAMGSVNERLGGLPEAHRSIHPTHSVIALGKKAEDYVCEHHLDTTPFGIHSPYFKLLENNAKILMLGATLNNLTYVHAIEDLIGDVHPIKCYGKEKYQVDCIDQNGHALKVSTTYHNPIKGIIRDLSPLHDDLLKEGAMVAFPFGEAEIMLIDVKKFTRFYLNQLLRGRSIYGRHHVSAELQKRIEYLLNYYC